jgi:hypothetical protein
VYLGLQVNTVAQRVFIPLDKRDYALRAVETLLQRDGSADLRRVQHVAGLLNSFLLAGQFVSALSRPLFMVVAGRLELAQLMNDPIWRALWAFWQSVLRQNPGRSWVLPGPASDFLLIFDASDHDLAAQLRSVRGNVVVSVSDVPDMRQTLGADVIADLQSRPSAVSSLLRELQAGHFALSELFRRYRDRFKGRAIRIINDNAGLRDVCSQLSSSVPAVFAVAADIWRMAFENDCMLSFEWRPRSDALVRQVDSLSKRDDATDWICVAYREVIDFFGVEPQLDVFASEFSTRCTHYYSRYLSASCAGADALRQPWSALPGSDTPVVCWLAPPFSLLSATVGRIVRDKVVGVLVFPAWQAPWRAVIDQHAQPRRFLFSGAAVQPAFVPSLRVPGHATAAWRTPMMAALFVWT